MSSCRCVAPGTQSGGCASSPERPGSPAGRRSSTLHGLLVAPGSLPGATALAVATEAAFAPTFLALLVLILVFPDGRLLSRRWRGVLVAAVLSFAGLWLIGSMHKLSAPFDGVANPLEQGSVPALVAALEVGVVACVVVLAIASVVGAFASLAIRFRRSRGDEREQLKWLVSAAVVLPLGIITHAIAESVAPGAVGTIELLFSIGLLAIPTAIGVAVLKYRLYDIDRIISRTLAYTALTAVLAALYAALVLLGQALFESFARGSNLTIAVSTLAVAALFLPVRARVQGFVDRRFNRHRYDAQRTLDAFGARLREQVELDALATELRGVVGETMAPRHVSLWLRRDPS